MSDDEMQLGTADVFSSVKSGDGDKTPFKSDLDMLSACYPYPSELTQWNNKALPTRRIPLHRSTAQQEKQEALAEPLGLGISPLDAPGTRLCVDGDEKQVLPALPF